ncbi:hypothetical protein [Fundidesulfovibrio magnetotacticus]|nr:hypothetical protein [Fundidesulfovibrio magnetotacticus]
MASAEASAKKVVLQEELPGRIERYSFDDARISAEALRLALRFGPDGLYTGSEMIARASLEVCPDDDPGYKPCGDRTIAAPNFLDNAGENLRRARALMEELAASTPPAGLEAAKAWCLEENGFVLALSEARLRYLRTWDPQTLRATFEVKSAGKVLEPGKLCPAAFEALSRAQNPVQRARVAAYEWHNCVNGAFRALEARRPYPTAAWKAFLKRYGITVRVEHDTD